MTKDTQSIQSEPEEITDPWIIFMYEVEMYWGMIRVREQIGEVLTQGGDWEIILKSQKLHANDKFEVLHKGQKGLVMFAMIEGKLLHMRILAELLIGNSKFPDDLRLDNLINNWEKDKELVKYLKELTTVYGNSREEGSPCWIINKRMAHPTQIRGDSFDYSSLFEKVDPPLKKCLKRIVEIKADYYLLNLLDQI